MEKFGSPKQWRRPFDQFVDAMTAVTAGTMHLAIPWTGTGKGLYAVRHGLEHRSPGKWIRD
ncbi:hypothetical protein GCM10009861_19370 [Neomicrococcus aestuarii]